MLQADINWLAALVTTLSYMVVGALWYGPLFQKPWMRLSGMTEESVKTGAGKAYAMMLIVAFVSVMVLAMLVKTLGAETFVDGMMVGFWIWLGFQATVMLNAVIFEKKPFPLYLLNAGYNLVAILIAGGILAVWM